MIPLCGSRKGGFHLNLNKLLGLLTAFVLFCMLPFPPLHVHAESGKLGDDITWEIKDDTLTLRGTGATYSYKKQKESPLWDFRCDFSAVVISNGITELADHALIITYRVNELSLPDSLKRIGANSFCGFSGTQLRLPYYLEYIGESAFFNASRIKTLTLPDTVAEIGDDAFNACIELLSVTIPNHKIRFGKGVFSMCRSLETVQLPDDMTEIPDRMFSGCANLQHVNLSDNLERICSYAFAGTGLTAVNIPESVKTIGENAFSDCPSLAQINLHEGLQSLGAECFQRCRAKEIYIPESVTEIGADCFTETRITQMALPTHKNLTIAEGALPESWLKTQAGFLILGDGILYQYRETAEPPEEEPDDDPEEPWLPEYAPPQLPDGNDVLNLNPAADSPDVLMIPEGVKTIYRDALRNLHAKELILPESLLEIRAHAIHDCAFETITIAPAAVGPKNCIEDCPELKTIRGKIYTDAQKFAACLKVNFEMLGDSTLPEPVMPDPEKDVFSFGNFGTVFGDSYSMPDDAEAALRKAADNSETVQQRLQEPWKGSCYGLSAVTVLAHEGVLTPAMLDPHAASLHDVKPDARSIGIINYYHISQNIPYITANDEGRSDQTALDRILRVARYAADYNRTGEPYVISIATQNGTGHAIVGYGLEKGEWTFNDISYDRRVRVWDSNYPDLNDNCCIYFDHLTLSWVLPAYGLSYDSASDTNTGGISFARRRTELLNFAPYPMEQVSGDFNGDLKCSAADAVLFARCIAEETDMPKYAYRTLEKADYNRDGTVDLLDLRALMQTL